MEWRERGTEIHKSDILNSCCVTLPHFVTSAFGLCSGFMSAISVGWLGWFTCTINFLAADLQTCSCLLFAADRSLLCAAWAEQVFLGWGTPCSFIQVNWRQRGIDRNVELEGMYLTPDFLPLCKFPELFLHLFWPLLLHWLAFSFVCENHRILE